MGAVGGPPATFTFRTIAGGEGWLLREFICRQGPQHRPFEERHEHVTIAAVVEGSFRYRCAAGTALLYPGALLLGQAGTCFECGHEHGTGDRCVAVHLAPALFEEVASAVTGLPRFRFPVAMLPANARLALPLVEAEAISRHDGANLEGEAAAMEEWAIGLAETALGVLTGIDDAPGSPSPRDQRRIGRALRHIEAHAEEPLDLAVLADAAAMSKYHFLRMFRRIAGVTPYRYLLGLRLRRAAARLCASSAPISMIAFEAGFGDLSTFNHRFREVFGASPSAFRRRHSGRARIAFSPAAEPPAL